MTSVMPLGDSITVGSGSTDGSGYRGPLADLISDASQSATFVGTQGGHEGHGGATITALRAGLVTWLTTNPPDVVLLLAGTNDLVTQPEIRAQDHAVTLGLLVDDIHEHDDAITVLVAPLPPLTTTQALRARAAQFNAAARREVDARDGAAWVPMQWQGSDQDDDEIHPNDDGYASLAGMWYRALRSLL